MKVTTQEIEAIDHLGDFIRDGLQEIQEEIHNISYSDIVSALDDIRSVADEMTNEISELRFTMKEIAITLERIANK